MILKTDLFCDLCFWSHHLLKHLKQFNHPGISNLVSCIVWGEAAMLCRYSALRGAVLALPLKHSCLNKLRHSSQAWRPGEQQHALILLTARKTQQ